MILLGAHAGSARPAAAAAAPTPPALNRGAYLLTLHRLLADVTLPDDAGDAAQREAAQRALGDLPERITVQDGAGSLAEVDFSPLRRVLQQEPPDLVGARAYLTALISLLAPGSLPLPTPTVTPPVQGGTPVPQASPAYLTATPDSTPGSALVSTDEAGQRLDRVLADPRFQTQEGGGIQKALADALAPAVQFLLQMPAGQRNLLIAAVVGLLVAFVIYSGYRDAPWSTRRYRSTIAAGGLGSAALVYLLLTYFGDLLAVFGAGVLPVGGALGVLVALGVVLYLIVNLRRERVRSGPRLAGAFGAEAGWTAAQARAAATTAARASDYRQAIRYRYLATLLSLDEAGRLRFDPALTNQEYLRRAPAGLRETLHPLVQIFDRLWYGGYPANAADYQDYQALAGRAEAPAPESTP